MVKTIFKVIAHLKAVLSVISAKNQGILLLNARTEIVKIMVEIKTFRKSFHALFAIKKDISQTTARKKKVSPQKSVIIMLIKI